MMSSKMRERENGRKKKSFRFVRWLGERWSDNPYLRRTAIYRRGIDRAPTLTRGNEDLLLLRSNTKERQVVLRIQISDAAFRLVRKRTDQASERHCRGVIDRRSHETTYDEPPDEFIPTSVALKTQLPSLLMMTKPCTPLCV